MWGLPSLTALAAQALDRSLRFNGGYARYCGPVAAVVCSCDLEQALILVSPHGLDVWVVSMCCVELAVPSEDRAYHTCIGLW